MNEKWVVKLDFEMFFLEKRPKNTPKGVFTGVRFILIFESVMVNKQRFLKINHK